MQSSRRPSGCFARRRQNRRRQDVLTRGANQRHYCIVAQFVSLPTAPADKGNVTQQASVIVSRKRPAPAGRTKAWCRRLTRTIPRRRAGRAGMSGHDRNTTPMLASRGAVPRAQRRIVSRAGSARQQALPHARRARRDRARQGETRTHASTAGPPGTPSPGASRSRPYSAKRGHCCGR